MSFWFVDSVHATFLDEPYFPKTVLEANHSVPIFSSLESCELYYP